MIRSIRFQVVIPGPEETGTRLRWIGEWRCGLACQAIRGGKA
jgi:hypothetical protein